MARNQRVSGSLGASKTVPLVTLHWVWQPAHCQYRRPSRRNEVRDCMTPQVGQTNPAGQGASTNACSYCSGSVERRGQQFL